MPARQPGSQAGSQRPRQPGSQEARQPGSQEASDPGSQESRKPGSQEARQPGSQEARDSGRQAGRRAGGRAGRQAGRQADSWQANESLIRPSATCQTNQARPRRAAPGRRRCVAQQTRRRCGPAICLIDCQFCLLVCICLCVLSF